MTVKHIKQELGVFRSEMCDNLIFLMPIMPAAASAGVGAAEININGFVSNRAITIVRDWMLTSPLTF